jgi:hypothetical protein
VDYYLGRGVSEYFIMTSVVFCGQYYAPWGVQDIAQNVRHITLPTVGVLLVVEVLGYTQRRFCDRTHPPDEYLYTTTKEDGG